MTDAIKTWPEKIYLQSGTGEELTFQDAIKVNITWCDERIEEHDVEYIRADLVKKILQGVK